MIKTFIYSLRISFRRLLKERFYTLINITGLAVSMASALLIFLYLQFETGYDTYHPEHENIYRMATYTSISGQETEIALNSLGIGPLLVESHTDFKSFTRLFPVGYFFREITYRYEDKSFKENNVFAADSTFFDFFAFDFIEGSPENALIKPFSYVMTQTMAERYFGDEPALGKLIHLEGAGTFEVSAVISDPPLNSHIQFDGLFSMTTMYQMDDLLARGFQPGITWRMMESFHGSRMLWVYVKTKEGFNPDEFVANQWYPLHEKLIGELNENYDTQPIFQPIRDIHLKSKLGYEMTDTAGTVTLLSPEIVRIFYGVAFLLLVVACINYTNISISQFHKRGKEAGIKKVIGAGKKDLILQYISEALFIAFIAFIFALLIVEIILPGVNHLLQSGLSIGFKQHPILLLALLASALTAGILSGIYPAMYFAAFPPIKIMTINQHRGQKSLGLKKVLLTAQFVISIFMVIATLVAHSQMSYINNKDLGFNPDNVAIIEVNHPAARSGIQSFANQLESFPEVESTALSNYYPTMLSINNSAGVTNDYGEMLSVSCNIIQVRPEYANFMEMELAAGRFFHNERGSDFYEGIIINETAQKAFGWKDAIGKEVNMFYHWPDGTPTGTRRVIGVVKDFYFTSLTRPIEPMLIYPMNPEANFLHIRFTEGQMKTGIEKAGQVWLQYQEREPLQMHILNDIIREMYQSQRVLSIFFTAFSIVCIIIAFMGLFGLSAYNVEQKTRQIAIRKIMGASPFQILSILTKDFSIIILVAGILASVLGWYAMNEWLSTFVYHTQLTIAPFIVGVASALIVAAAAIISHAIRAIKMNESMAIKYE